MTRVIIEGCGMNLFYDSMEEKRAIPAIRKGPEEEVASVIVISIRAQKNSSRVFIITVSNAKNEKEEFKGDYDRFKKYGELSKLH